MKTYITTLILLCIVTTDFANDGAYFSRGGIIYPIRESKISLEKEILSFSVHDKICRVNIMFEFNNTENSPRNILLGFQAPSSVGDVPDEVSNKSQIKNFQT